MKWQFGIGLLLGFGIAWFSKPEKITRETEENTRVRPAAAARPERHVRKIDPKIESYLDELAASPGDDELLENVETDRLPAIIKAFAKRAGIVGLSGKEQGNFGNLLKKWYENDPSAALAWIDTLENLRDRRTFQIKIIGNEAEKDLGKALAMIGERDITFENESVPYGIVESIARSKMGAEEMLKVLSLLRRDKESGWSS